MSDLFAMLNRAARALDAQRLGLDVAGQNITNVNTPGYVRRTAVLAESTPTDPFGPGGGVDVIAVTSSRAPLIEARLQYEQPAASREKEVAERLSTIEAGLGQAGSSIDASLAAFYNTYAALSQNPTSSTARQQVIVEGQDLASDFNAMATRLRDARVSADSDIRALVPQVNALASQLADLNRQISATNGENVAGLQDQQAVVIGQISELVDVHSIQHEDGSIELSIGNGRALVVGSSSFDLTATVDSSDGTVHVVSAGAAEPTDISNEITGGRIAGIINVRDNLLPGYMSQLDQLAYHVATDVNAVVTTGYDLDGNAGVAFFTPPASVAGAAATMSVNSAVVANNHLVVTASTTAPGNNDIAQAVAALQDQPMTGSAARPVDGWSTLVYSVARDSSTAQQAQASHEQITQQLHNLRDQVTGVSLDEEAAMLMRFQRAYEANARFFQVANDLLDTLVSLGQQ